MKKTKEDSRLEWVLSNNVLSSIEIDDTKIREYFSKFIKKKPNSSKEDFLWSLLQFLLIETTKTSKDACEMYKNHSYIYFNMARFRMDYENEKDHRLFQLAHNNQIKSYGGTGFKMQVKVISGHCCEYCDSLNEKTFDLDYAIKNKMFDLEKCTRKLGCNCTTAGVPKRYKNGSLMRIESEPKKNKSHSIKKKKNILNSIFNIFNK